MLAGLASEYRRGLIGSQVEVSNTLCGPVINESMVNESAIVDVICNPPVTGQHVRIQFGGFLQFVHICEIRVYSDEIEKSECTSDPHARDYRGIVDVTSSGIICQKWTAVWPHISWYRFGDYNLCRNSDWDTAWCYTIDPAVRYRRCDIPETGSTCPRDKYEDNLQPLNICNGVSHWLMHDDSKFASGVYGASEQPIEINVPSNIIASIPNGRRFDTCSNSFTLAFYIFPYRHSNGPILTFGNTDNTRFTIVQVIPNGAYNMYNSDIIVSYGNSDVLRTNVLLPETWTFLAITFDGQHKLLTVWRDGEIARIANTAFTSIDMDFDDIQFGLFDNSFDGVVAHVSWLQMYGRVLNEAERLKNARVYSKKSHHKLKMLKTVLYTSLQVQPSLCVPSDAATI
ncbi:uncharacterized protein [Antedon mediterranea]|uniref:uncharacterized protein n=1 Tax=Antedon mediterranea TaxID=105859 RepID=UPI003AF41F4A